MQQPPIQEVSLQQMLAAREERAGRQRALLARYQVPLLCFTMNLPGGVKRGPLPDRGFAMGMALIRRQLAAMGLTCLYAEARHPATGSEGYLCVQTDADRLKRAALDIEEHTPAGRLFDMDVMKTDGTKVPRAGAGFGARTCLLCDRPAHACARSRAHDIRLLAAHAQEQLSAALAQWDAHRIAELACRALLNEACTTPKPGLVDAGNTGSHRDMNLFTFMASTCALWPFFEACAHAGTAGADRPAPETMAALRPLGRLAEGAMRAATGGVNTHKGAVFTLGVVCAALGRLENSSRANPNRVLAAAAEIARGITGQDFAGITKDNARTAGERLYAWHGITGARGQLEAGLPAVRLHGLPALRQALADGLPLNDAGCLALLHLIANTDDTSLIARGGLEGQRAAAREVRRVLARSPHPDRAALDRLDHWFIKRNLSPGGSADLLAVCYLLLFMLDDPLKEDMPGV